MPHEIVPVVLVPLHDRWGNLKHCALIDPVDAERVMRWSWSIRNSEGYVGGVVDGKRVSLQRFIYGDVPDGYVLDHINRWRLDNRRQNLRVVTTAQNAQNQGSRGGSSKYRGVTWDKSRSKWLAQTMLDGRCHHLGRFDSEDEAAVAVAAFRAEHMPFSAEAA
jgi:hypothetical protein